MGKKIFNIDKIKEIVNDKYKTEDEKIVDVLRVFSDNDMASVIMATLVGNLVERYSSRYKDANVLLSRAESILSMIETCTRLKDVKETLRNHDFHVLCDEFYSKEGVYSCNLRTEFKRFNTRNV